MYKHALVGVDFSPGWPAVRSYLVPLARQLGIQRFTLVYVLESSYGKVSAIGHQEYYRKQMSALADELTTAGFNVETAVKIGRPACELLVTASEVAADCLILGSLGQVAWREFFLGSVALDVARRTTLPLVLVPSGLEASTGDGPIILATDGSQAATYADSQFLEMKNRGYEGIAVYVATPPCESGRRTSEKEQALARLAELARKGIKTHCLEGDTYNIVSRLAQEKNASLIIVGKRGHNPLRELLLGSTAEGICRQNVAPVLLVPSPSDK